MVICRNCNRRCEPEPPRELPIEQFACGSCGQRALFRTPDATRRDNAAGLAALAAFIGAIVGGPGGALIGGAIGAALGSVGPRPAEREQERRP